LKQWKHAFLVTLKTYQKENGEEDFVTGLEIVHL
jgi:hypothetical protein